MRGEKIKGEAQKINHVFTNKMYGGKHKKLVQQQPPSQEQSHQMPKSYIYCNPENT